MFKEWCLERTYKVYYCGNGATAFTKKKYLGKKVQGEVGKFRYRASQVVFFPRLKLRDYFVQEGARQVGYQMRRKSEKLGRYWEWYCTDGQWHAIGDIAKNKEITPAVFRVGQRISFADFGLRKGEETFFEAKWENETTGEEMECGWYVYRNKLMAHALGVSESGKSYQNTRAVFERSYEKGYRYFEVDLALTTDGKLVCCHGWSKKNCEKIGMEYQPSFENMTYDLFMQQKVDGNPVMDIYGLRQIMEEYPDTYFEIDLHKKMSDIIPMTKLLVEAMKDAPHLFDRLLIQAQSRLFFREIRSVHSFLNTMVIAGEDWPEIMDLMIAFALETGVCAIALRKDLATPEHVAMIRAAGLYVMIYTISEDAALAREWLERGANTICTDRLTLDCL